MLTRTSMRWPRPIVGFWLVAAACMAVFSLQLPHDVKAGGFNDEHGSALAGQIVNEKAFHDPANELAVVLRAKSPITPQALEKAKRTAHAVSGVSTIVDAAHRPELASHDRRTQVLVIGFSTDNTATQNEVQPLRKHLEEAFSEDGVETHVTGAPALDYDLNMQSSEDAQQAEMIAFPLLIVVLLVVYRAVAPTLVTLAVAGISLTATQGIGDLLARAFDISNMYITGASLIGLAVSVDYCLFFIKRYQEFLEGGHSLEDALKASQRTAGHAIRFGGSAVIAALATLFIPRNMVFSSIAISGILVTLLAMTLTATFLPALLTVLGKRSFWGKLPGFTRRHSGVGSSASTTMALRAPAVTAGVLGVLFLGLAAPLASLALRVPVASASILPEGADSRQGIEALQAKVDARLLFPVTVTITDSSLDGALAETAKVDSAARALPETASTLSATSAPGGRTAAQSAMRNGEAFTSHDIPLVTHAGHEYVSRVVVIGRGSPDSESAHKLTASLRSVADGLAVPAYVSGATAQGDDFDNLVARSIPWIVISVALVSVVLLGFAFRSLWLPLIALTLNALVVCAAMGTLTFAWKALTGADINSVTPIVLFAIVFGLSMDYMVLMANRMKEEYLRLGDHRQAIAQGSYRTSRLVTSAAVIMMAVFLSFFVAKISIVRELGAGLAIAVFLDAFVVRTLLMPAVLALMGKRVWGRTPA